MIPQGFISLTNVGDRRHPTTIHVKAASIDGVGCDETEVYTLLTTAGRSWCVAETPKDILGMIAQATAAGPDLEMARLLHAVWSPAMETVGHLSIRSVAEFLQMSPDAVRTIYQRAAQLAKGTP